MLFWMAPYLGLDDFLIGNFCVFTWSRGFTACCFGEFLGDPLTDTPVVNLSFVIRLLSMSTLGSLWWDTTETTIAAAPPLVHP